MVLAMINTVFAQESLEAATGSGASSPTSCVSKFRSLPDARSLGGRCARVHELPKAHHKQIHSTNPLSAQRRDQAAHDVVGIFPNESAITRLVGALLLEQSASGACSGVTCSLKDCKRSRQSDHSVSPGQLSTSPTNQAHDSYTTRGHDLRRACDAVSRSAATAYCD